MHPLTRQLAIAQARADGEARVIAHAGTIWIVTPSGEIWQVFDSEGPNRETRATPRNDASVWARIFVGVDDNAAVRIYQFGLDESRSTVARRLSSQLEGAKLGDERAA